MNYEELLNAQDGTPTQREQLPVGFYYKKLIDQKYRHVVELKPSLVDSIVFYEALKTDQKTTLRLRSKQQLHYELHEDSGGVYELELEQGNYQPLTQLLSNNPAIVASKGFVDNMIDALMNFTEELHRERIFHLCYAPQSVFVGKGDNEPMLLCHGSSFLSMSNVGSLYEGFEEFVAPEVLAREQVDERSDVYSLGKLIEYIFNSSEMPYEIKKMVKKATVADPNQRYKTIDDMRSAYKQRRNMRRSLITLAAALAIVLVGVWAYFEMVPEPVVVEFENHPKADVSEVLPDDPYTSEELYDPDMLELLGINPDSVDLSVLSDEEMRQLTDSANQMMRAEAIFRKNFQREAERRLSKIYDNSYMGANEQNVMANSRSTMDDLMQIKEQLARDAGLNDERAGRIYTEVITQITAEHQKKAEEEAEAEEQ